MFRHGKWTVQLQGANLFALYELTPFNKRPVCKSLHFSLSAAVSAISRDVISEKGTTDDLLSLWDSMASVYENAGVYATA